MKKHIVMFLATLWVVLFGTVSHGAVSSPYGRQVTIDIVPLSFFDVSTWKTFDVQQSVLFEQYLKAATDRVASEAGSPSAFEFNRLPFRWLTVVGSVATDPKTEADLTYAFETVSNGATYPRPLRTMRIFFVNSLPDASALTSGTYRKGSLGGVSWVFRTQEYYNEIAFALGGPPSAANQQTFVEAFRVAFVQKHGLENFSSPFDGGDVIQLRTALLAPYGVGCYEPIVTGTLEFSNKISAHKQWLFKVSSRDHIPNRCYRLEYSTDMKSWTELWFTSSLPASKDFYYAVAGKPKAFYRLSLCWDK